MNNDHSLDVLEEVFRERERQDVKWGEQNHPDTRAFAVNAGLCAFEAQRAKDVCANDVRYGEVNWRNILDEEVKEAFEQAACGDKGHLREELIQVAAVAVAWIECIDRRKK